jgi:TetR/AcrR family transcriptional repressor of nem operon
MSTRDRILDVAQELVQTIGANAMSYQHISDAIQIRKASIHHHFPTKENLIESMIERYTTYFFSLVDRIAGANKTGAAKLRDYVRLFEATLQEGAHEKACVMGMLGAEVRTLGPVAVDRVRQFYTQNERRLALILEAGKRDGSLKFEGTAEGLAAVLFAVLEGGLLVARGRGEDRHFQVTIAQLFRMIEK